MILKTVLFMELQFVNGNDDMKDTKYVVQEDGVEISCDRTQ